SKEKVTATVTVTNKGKKAGEEVVQLYLRHEDAGEDEPGYVLKGFKRIALQPGASQKVSFSIGTDELKIIDEIGKAEIRPGLIHLFIGGSLPGDRSEALGASKVSGTTITLK
ncbi:MAG TPA: fibronectin type III-like domain-contianing protein, partial [Chitinophagaceae bacterium]|nr:fibronectin type III-like domain-contianing protein [Chitinophagaceae bacterium]